MNKLEVPFFRPALGDEEVNEVVATLRSGWLTSGPKVKRFEEAFAATISSNGPGAKENGNAVHAIALN